MPVDFLPKKALRVVELRLKILGVGGVGTGGMVAQFGQSEGHMPVPWMTGSGGLSSEEGEPLEDGLDSSRGGGLSRGGVEQTLADELYDDVGLCRGRGGGRDGPCSTAATTWIPLPNRYASFSPGAMESKRVVTVSWSKTSL